MAHDLLAVWRPEDWHALHRIRRETLFTAERHPGVVYDPNHPLDRMPNHVPYLLMFDGTPIGVVRLDFRGAEAVERLVAISPALQGQGHGRALGELVDAEARRRGVRRLMLNAISSAAGFYEHTGWHREIWDAAELTGIASDCIQMVKLL